MLPWCCNLRTETLKLYLALRESAEIKTFSKNHEVILSTMPFHLSDICGGDITHSQQKFK